MIELVNPDDVAGVNRTDDVLDGELLSGESAIIAKSVEKRRREFVTVRVRPGWAKDYGC